jgi:hypothetical protein
MPPPVGLVEDFLVGVGIRVRRVDPDLDLDPDPSPQTFDMMNYS